MELMKEISLPVSQFFLIILLACMAGGVMTLLGGRALTQVTDRGFLVISLVVIIILAIGLSVYFDWTLYGSLMAASLIAIGPLSLVYMARKRGDNTNKRRVTSSGVPV